MATIAAEMALLPVEAFERAGLKAWPSLETAWDGAWLRRAAGGYTKRANCVQCFDPGDDDAAEERLLQAAGWMAARGLPPVMRLTPLTGVGVIAALDRLGWRSIETSQLFAMTLAASAPDPRIERLGLLDPQFLDIQQRLQAYSERTAANMRALLAQIQVPAIGLVAYRDGRPAATALAALAGDIVITGNVVTHPNFRRQGLAGAVMRSGHAWAHARGARIAALNVVGDNFPAKALYAGMGYAHQYDYSYRIPGAS